MPGRTLRQQLAAGLALAGAAAPALGNAPDLGNVTTLGNAPAYLDPVQVTATRVEESTERVPASITIVRGEDLRARGVRDLAGAVALAAGIEAPPGGDTGPAGAVPSLWGLHEFDAFLLVVDGVPWGGAFNPAIPVLSLANVERVEILRGAAPVLFGATSFVGVIHVIHYPAGRASEEAEAGIGSHGSASFAVATALRPVGSLQQSMAIDGLKQGYGDARESVKNGHLDYRATAALAGGTLGLDAELALVRQKPSSPVVRQGAALATLTPLDANYNPGDARIDENRLHVALRYSRDTALGRWETTVSGARSAVTDIRGFLRPELVDDGSQNADSQAQRRTVVDDYVDSHIAIALGGGVTLVGGADLLYGMGRQASVNGAYYASLRSPDPLPATTALHVDEINTVSDERLFGGQYVQAQWQSAACRSQSDARPVGAEQAQAPWQPGTCWTLLGGLRLNEARERLASAHIDGYDPTANLASDVKRQVFRASGTVGATARVWTQGRDTATVYADVRNAFKPAAIDFGPDYRPDLLKPETANSAEAGLKTRTLDGALEMDLSAFVLDFRNLVVTTTDSLGNPLVQNAGKQRLKGVEWEGRFAAARNLDLSASASLHDARFLRYVASEGGANVDAGGRQLPLSPSVLLSLGLQYAPDRGLGAGLVIRHVGARYMDIANSASTPGYTTVDCTISYRWQQLRVAMDGTNLGNRRDPVSASEFGDQSFYLLPGRAWWARVAMSVAGGS